jgi:hypothetical protein
MAKEKKTIKTVGGRLSYAYLATPKPKPQKNGKDVPARYETVVLLDPTNPAHKKSIDEIKAEAIRVAQEKFGANVELKKLVLAFGNGDKKAIDEDGQVNPTYEAYRGMFYVNTSTSDKPRIYNRNREIIGKDHPQFPYSGCYANVNFDLYAWTFTENNMTRRGVSVNLQAVQFDHDGEAFGGRTNVNPEDDFEALGDAPGTASAGSDFDFD